MKNIWFVSGKVQLFQVLVLGFQSAGMFQELLALWVVDMPELERSNILMPISSSSSLMPRLRDD